ncbi:MAG: hypothetical protein ACQBVK_05145 [Candidatus Phytoplasma sp. TWB_XP]
MKMKNHQKKIKKSPIQNPLTDIEKNNLQNEINTLKQELKINKEKLEKIGQKIEKLDKVSKDIKKKEELQDKEMKKDPRSEIIIENLEEEINNLEIQEKMPLTNEIKQLQKELGKEVIIRDLRKAFYSTYGIKIMDEHTRFCEFEKLIHTFTCAVSFF